MKKEQLIELGIDEEIAKKVMDLNGADIQREAGKIKKAEDERNALQAQLDTANEALKSFEGIDPANLKDELKKAQDALLEAQEKHQSDIAKRDSLAETERFLGDKKFINDITKAYIAEQIETALGDAANKGKNREDIFKTLTQTEDGKPKDGIFADENPNPLLELPPSGGAGPSDVFQKRLAKYQK